MQKGSAASGREALDILTNAAASGMPYDIALLDMQMPEMDGLTLARTIKGDPAIARTRLIILTSLGQQPEASELKRAGIEAYLIKPVKQGRLFDCLISMMSKSPPTVAGNATGVTQTASPVKAGSLAKHKPRVLLAEDNAINQKVALRQLHQMGCTADAVGNGVEALAALLNIPYDIVLMDCQMPEMDGYEAARTIRLRETDSSPITNRTARVYIIAMTANALQGDREKCLAAGMDDYVSKPVRTADLEAALGRWKPAGATAAVEPVNPPAVASDESKASAPVPIAEAPAVNWAHLVETAGDDPAAQREIVDLYLKQAEELLGSLQGAIEANSAGDVAQVAHKLGGSSSTCGMVGIVRPLRELEIMGKTGRLMEPGKPFNEARRQLGRIREFLEAQLAAK
jgi:CheY-like chemotaxis protein